MKDIAIMEAELDSAPDSDKELEAIFQGVTSTEPALNIPARSVAAALGRYGSWMPCSNCS